MLKLVYLFVELKTGAAIPSLVLLSVWAPLEAPMGAHRRAQAASDLALSDARSFADVLPQWNSRRDFEAARLERPAVAQPGAVEHG